MWAAGYRVVAVDVGVRIKLCVAHARIGIGRMPPMHARLRAAVSVVGWFQSVQNPL